MRQCNHVPCGACGCLIDDEGYCGCEDNRRPKCSTCNGTQRIYDEPSDPEYPIPGTYHACPDCNEGRVEDE